ncbi:MAG: HIT domain-containing protein [Promethearchaeota archaeon]
MTDKFSDDALFKSNLHAIGKSKYVTGKRPDIYCILCGVRDDSDKIVSKKIYQDDVIFITLNLYPFNPGHLMIVPCRHVERWRDLHDIEISRITEYLKKVQDLIQREFNTGSFNVGFNEGPFSGASITHFHLHVVPRFKNELGFIDIIGKTRSVIYTVDEVYSKLKDKL